MRSLTVLGFVFKSASFTDEGEAKALELLKQYGITLEQHGGEESGIDGTK